MVVLTGLFAPDRVAVVGATAREGSLGRALMENLLADFEGELVAVNPNYDEVLGVPCVGSIGETEDVDLAVVAVPAAAAVAVVREAAEAGIENVAVITAGFGETDEAGAERERELVRIAAEHDLNLVGPNSLGVIGTAVGLNATFAPINPQPGSLSFLSQSGAVVTSVLDWAEDEGIGFKDVVSLGNKTVLDEVDFIEAWEADPDTDVIIGYLESVADGRAFLDRVGEVTRSTPVVLLKAGRSAAGAQAAASHTGAIAGSERAVEAGLRQAGVLRARSLLDLFDMARALAGQPLPDADGVAVVSNAGGLGVLATDAIADTSLELASLGDDTAEALEEVLPETAEVHNPVDIIGDADVARFAGALDAVLPDPAVGAAVVLSAPSALLDFDGLARTVAEAQREHGVPVVTCLMGGDRVRSAERLLRDCGVPNYPDPSRAVRGVEALARYRAVRARPPPEPAPFDVDRARVQAVLDRAADRGVSTLGVEAIEVLSAFGVPTAAGELVTSPSAAEAAAAELGGPVALKIVSPEISHKTEVDGVAVGVEPADAAARYTELVERVEAHRPDAAIEGVLVQEGLDLEAGVETLVGITRDPQFGPLVAFGLGGIYVEVFADAAVRVAPVDAPTAREMTEELTAAPILRGARGKPAVDLDAVVETVQRVSLLAVEFPAIRELDVNPLIATPDGVVAVDFRATLDLDRV
ncbi:MAG: acetate--CoA ligase family protein [Halobacteriales archaeon]|nr:acetate--CoA ligase family protein [Halobacteriales archaeon]